LGNLFSELPKLTMPENLLIAELNELFIVLYSTQLSFYLIELEKKQETSGKVHEKVGKLSFINFKLNYTFHRSIQLTTKFSSLIFFSISRQRLN
jgi:hypothetical protein